MPIIVNDFTWNESNDFIDIEVPLKGTNPKKINVYASDMYVNLNFAPYFFELDLKDCINHTDSEVKVAGGKTIFHLKKQSAGLWRNVKYLGSDARERRKQSMERQLEEETQRKEQKLREKAEKEKYMIQQQMKVEREAKDAILKKKQAHANEAINEINNWSIKIKRQTAENSDDESSDEDDELAALEKALRDSLAVKNAKKLAPIRNSGSNGETLVMHLDFTKTSLPTSARETKNQNYEQWLQSQGKLLEPQTAQQ